MNDFEFTVCLDDGVLYFTNDNGSGCKYPVKSGDDVVEQFRHYLECYCGLDFKKTS